MGFWKKILPAGKTILRIGLKYGGELAPAPFGTAIKFANKLVGSSLDDAPAAATEGAVEAPAQAAPTPFDEGDEEEDDYDE